MKKISLISFLILTSLFSQNKDISSSYNGNTGILETPNARVLDDWSMRFFYNQDKPYTYFGLSISPLRKLELNLHMTKIHGVKAFNGTTNYGDNKDKSINVKYLLKEEGMYLPSFAFGLDDIWGTSLYSSKYFVLSKNISFFDFSLGYAKGRLGGENLTKYAKNSRNSGSFNNNSINFIKDKSWSGGKLFGSVLFKASPNLQLMLEYSPINYKYDKSNPFLSGKRYSLPKSRFNYGLKYKFRDNTIFTLSHQRGNQLSFGLTYQFGFNKEGMLPHIKEPRWKANKKALDEYKNINEKELSEKISYEVAAEEFSNVKTSVNNNKIWTEINNNKRFNNDLQALGRALSVVDEVAPKKYDTFYITLKQRELPLKTLKVNRTEFDLFENEKVSDNYMKDALKISNNVENEYNEFSKGKELYKSKSYNYERFNYSIRPKVRTMLNHKDKAFAMKALLRANAKYYMNDNMFLTASIDQPFYHSGKDLSNQPLENKKLSIRSNVTEHFVYNKTQMSSLGFSYINRAPYSSFVKADIGYLEYAYAGMDLEWYKPMFDEKFGIGLQYQGVYKRKVGDFFALDKEYFYDAKFLNLYYLASTKYDLHLGAKVGQFLAGDKGVRLDLSRHHKDFTIGAFLAFTDSKKVFSNSENQGYVDKGVYIKFPFTIFTNKNVKRRLILGLKPWTRDVAQYSGTFNSLYPMNNKENNTQIMKKYINKFKE